LFGYIKPFKPQLRMCEYDTYKAMYCGLCGQLGKSFGCAARLTLSYDFTFLCMLHSALGEESPEFSRRSCYVNPLKKVPVCAESEALRFSADTATIMIYYKLLDNMHDERGIARLGWSCLHPFVRGAYKKAAAARPDCDRAISRSVAEQTRLEEEGCSNVDSAADPTARAMADIFVLLSSDGRRRRILERLGYLVGRFVYLCDALDDLEEDLRTGSYNPYALGYGLQKDDPAEKREQVAARARESLNATAAEAAKAFDLLDITAFRPILENVLFLGMAASIREILAKKEKIR